MGQRWSELIAVIGWWALARHTGQEASRWGSVAQGTWEPHPLWPRPSRRADPERERLKAGPHLVCLRQAGSAVAVTTSSR